MVTNKIVVDFLRVCIRVNGYCQRRGFTLYKEYQDSDKWGKDGAPGHHILKVIDFMCKHLDDAHVIGQMMDGRNWTLQDFITSIDNHSPYYDKLKEAGQDFWSDLDAQDGSALVNSNVVGFYKWDIDGNLPGGRGTYQHGLVHYYGIDHYTADWHLGCIKQRLYEIAYLETQADPFNSLVALYAIKEMSEDSLKSLDIYRDKQGTINEILNYVDLSKHLRSSSFYKIALFMPDGIYTTQTELDEQTDYGAPQKSRCREPGESRGPLAEGKLPEDISAGSSESYIAYKAQDQRLGQISHIYVRNKEDIPKGLAELKEYVNSPEHRDHFIGCINGHSVMVEPAPPAVSTGYSKITWGALSVVCAMGIFAAYKYLMQGRVSHLTVSSKIQAMYSLKSR